MSNRAKVDREKASQMASAKKHKRFDSLANDQYLHKRDPLGSPELAVAV